VIGDEVGRLVGLNVGCPFPYGAFVMGFELGTYVGLDDGLEVGKWKTGAVVRPLTGRWVREGRCVGRRDLVGASDGFEVGIEVGTDGAALEGRLDGAALEGFEEGLEGTAEGALVGIDEGLDDGTKVDGLEVGVNVVGL